MAKDRTAELESELLQGARGVDNKAKSMRERLADHFSGGDLVTIKNSLDHDFGYVYTDPREESVEQPNPATRRVNYGDPKARVLKKGEQRVVPGWEAYIALVRMWKEFAQEQSGSIGVVMNSAEEADAFIKRSYHGIYNPNQQATTAAPSAPHGNGNKGNRSRQQSQPKAPTTPTEDDTLGFSDEEGNSSDK